MGRPGSDLGNPMLESMPFIHHFAVPLTKESVSERNIAAKEAAATLKVSGYMRPGIMCFLKGIEPKVPLLGIHLHSRKDLGPRAV